MATKGGKFFDERTDESEVKARIIEKYFSAWANIVLGTAQRFGDGRIGYIDLYAGPGRYKDGSASTPLLILEKMIAQEKFHNAFFAYFNDGDANHSATLEEEIKALPGLKKLKHQPQVGSGPVDVEAATSFEKMKMIPTFTFFDPFGYKGLSLQIVNSVIKDWGCDCVFFFNYNRINAGISNVLVDKHMNALFTKERADLLRVAVNGKSPSQREALILEHMALALKEMKGEYVLPFCFKNESRTSHYLFFVTKSFKGYEVMKDIMAGESSTVDGGVASFAYSPADKDTPYLFSFLQPLTDLMKGLLKEFAGKTLTMHDIYFKYEHLATTPFIKKNYKAVLGELETEGKITADPPAKKRPMRSGARTFGDTTKVTFPLRKTK
ncbi:MAG: three-Cys-motif partner protein TcmP [Reyranella sp.]|nr:three-Cys-motif partner protein TcmP [Reyranella sp.]